MNMKIDRQVRNNNLKTVTFWQRLNDERQLAHYTNFLCVNETSACILYMAQDTNVKINHNNLFTDEIPD